MGEKLDISRQCALTVQKANHTLGFKRNMASRMKEAILLLYSSLVRPHLEPCSTEGPPAQEGQGPAGVGSEESTRIRWLEHLYCEDRLRELVLLRAVTLLMMNMGSCG